MKLSLARTTAIAFAALLGLSILASIAPSAVAQQGASVVVDIRSPDNIGTEGRLSPESELAEAPVKVTITLPPIPSGCAASYTVKYTVTGAPGYSTPIMNPSGATGNVGSTAPGGVSTGQTADTTIVKDTKLIVSVSRDAPAFKDEAYKVKAEIIFTTQTGGCTITGGQNEGSTVIKNDYLPLTTVNPAQYFQKAGQNKKVIFPIDVVNLGNGPTRVRVEVVQPNKNKLDSLIPPAELLLESRAQRGASALFKQTTKIEAQTPHSNGYTNSVYSFNVKFLSSYGGGAATGTLNDETQVTLSVQVQGVYVPGFDPVMALGALGIALAGFAAVRRKT